MPRGKPGAGRRDDKHILKSIPRNRSMATASSNPNQNCLGESETQMSNWSSQFSFFKKRKKLTSRGAPAVGLRPSGSQKSRSRLTGPAQPPTAGPQGGRDGGPRTAWDLHTQGPLWGSPLPATRSHEGGSHHSTVPVPQPPREPRNDGENGRKGGWSLGPLAWACPLPHPHGAGQQWPQRRVTQKLRTRPHLE